MFATHGEFSEQFLIEEECINVGDCLCGRVATSGMLKVSDNCFTDHEHEHNFDDMSVHGHYIVPLKYAGNVLGVLFLYTDPYPSREPERIETLSSLGAMLGLAITNEQSQQALITERAAAIKSNKAKSEFLSSMSHELRTPLNAILGFGQLLETDSDDPLSKDQKESITYITDSGKHLLTLINRILELSSIEAGKVNLTLESVNLDELTQEAIILVNNSAQQRGVALKLKAKNKELFVLADVTKLKQVLLNLLSNAIKYNTILKEAPLLSVMKSCVIIVLKFLSVILALVFHQAIRKKYFMHLNVLANSMKILREQGLA